MTQPLEFTVRVDAPDEDLEEIDRATRDLLMELREEPVEAAEIRPGPPSGPGTKGLESVAAEIAVIVLPSVIKLVLEKLQRKNVTIRFEGRLAGNPVKFEGAASAFSQLLNTLTQASGKKN